MVAPIVAAVPLHHQSIEVQALLREAAAQRLFGRLEPVAHTR